ncbi:MAG: septum formation initiator [Methylotenera sp.]|nr:septum formation initiator [Oligoflexia bacterium]
MKFQVFTATLATLAIFSASLQSAHADPKEYYYQQYLKRLAAAAAKKSPFGDPRRMSDPSVIPAAPAVAAQAGAFDQRINPDDASDTRTFKQRYWISTTYSHGENSPVLYFICGEAECSAGDLGGATSQHAQKLGATVVALEHRYFGKSQPFPEMTTANMKYLTTSNALKDLATFQTFTMQKLNLKGKWVSIGGSYPGALSAYYRLKFPNLIAGSLASSAPVLARANFEEYDHHVFKVAGPDCAKVMQQVTSSVEAAMQDPQKALAMKTLFGGKEIIDTVDFLYVVADMGAIAIQYDHRDQLCDAIQGASDPVKAYAQVGRQLFADFGMTPLQDTPQAMLSTKASDYSSGVGLRQWTYLICNEYGYYQTAFHDPKESVRSSKIDLNYHNTMCKRVFGITTPVNAAATNRNFYQPLLNAQTKNIYFTNGANDPWSNLSITQKNGNATNPNLAFDLIAGAAHCDDLGLKNSSALQDSRARFVSLASKWTNAR